MGVSSEQGLVQCGREIEASDIEHVQSVLKMCPGLSRRELVYTLCEHWGWVTATGSAKFEACQKLLDKLEAEGLIKLPTKRKMRRPRGGPHGGGDELALRGETDPGQPIACALTDLKPVRLEVVSDSTATALWKEYVDRYHYLGYRKPFGCALRYFITSRKGCLGCVILAGAAKSIGVRDRWIGWDEKHRLRNLPWVINNWRFLLFPWVEVKALASHVLGRLARQVQGDWEERWGYRPVLMETFVDPLHFEGTCYRAAGWRYLGRTTGQGLLREGCQYTTSPKLMYVRPLVQKYREWLCGDGLRRRVEL